MIQTSLTAADSKLIPFPRFAEHDTLHPSEPSLKWSWATRVLSNDHELRRSRHDFEPPRVGDVAVFRVTRIGNHTKIELRDNSRTPLFDGDRVVAVFGNRYATDAYEGEVDGLEDLALLTAGGMAGCVRSRSSKVKSPTKLEFLGYVTDAAGRRVSSKLSLAELRRHAPSSTPVFFVVGTGMNAGKTTTASRLVHALSVRGIRVAAVKLTGSVSPRDYSEFRATGAVAVMDFSDYGYPSTYKADLDEIVALFHKMRGDCQANQPEVMIVEIADGLLQRETAMLLADARIQGELSGIVLAAGCSSSALYAAQRLESQGQRIVAVSGLLTSSPLFMREFEAESDLPLVSSAGDAAELADAVLAALPPAAIEHAGGC